MKLPKILLLSSIVIALGGAGFWMDSHLRSSSAPSPKTAIFLLDQDKIALEGQAGDVRLSDDDDERFPFGVFEDVLIRLGPEISVTRFHELVEFVASRGTGLIKVLGRDGQPPLEYELPLLDGYKTHWQFDAVRPRLMASWQSEKFPLVHQGEVPTVVHLLRFEKEGFSLDGTPTTAAEAAREFQEFAGGKDRFVVLMIVEKDELMDRIVPIWRSVHSNHGKTVMLVNSVE